MSDIGWGLDRPNPLQPPSGQHRFPPYYDSFLPRGTCAADHPGSPPIMVKLQQQSNPYEGMTKQEIRNLPDSRDKIMNVEGHRQLQIRYGQAKFKVKDHGALTLKRLKVEQKLCELKKILQNL